MNEHDRRRSRRTALRLIGASAAAAFAQGGLAQSASPDKALRCVLTPAQTEGPYFVDERLNRSDVRTNVSDGSVKPGALLALDLALFGVNGNNCTALRDAIVDIWQCDATGIYSDVDDMRLSTRGAKFLRGYQVTDADGHVRFTTIYPGAYPGRAVHIHFKVRPQSGRGEFTSQLYFDDALTDRVHASAPYSNNGSRRTRNDRDRPYRAGGKALQLDVVSRSDGYAAAFDVGVRVA